ncbi:unnamed protein product [Lampetra fluviatilis]
MMERGALERRAKIGDVWISRCGKDTRARFVALAYSLRRLRGSQQRREEEVQKGAGISPKTTHDGSSRRANAEPAAFPRLLSQPAQSFTSLRRLKSCSYKRLYFSSCLPDQMNHLPLCAVPGSRWMPSEERGEIPRAARGGGERQGERGRRERESSSRANGATQHCATDRATGVRLPRGRS